MNSGDYLRAIRSDGQATLDAAGLGLDSPVPTTPGWTVEDVVSHLGRVHRQKAHIVRELLVAEPPMVDPPPRDSLLEWFAEGVHDLTEILSVTDPSTPVHTWHEPDQTVGFWIRRMAHETLIHRVDAELGHGIHSPVETELGADGVDEILDVFMGGYPEWAEVERSPVVVRLESEGRSWPLQFLSWTGRSPNSGREFTDVAGIEIAGGDPKPAAVVRGPGDALDLFLWGRGSADGLIAVSYTHLTLPTTGIRCWCGGGGGG